MKKHSSYTSNFLESMFKSLEEMNIRYCVLRNFEDLPYSLSARDIDILVSSNDRGVITDSVKNIAKSQNFLIYKYFQNDRQFQIYLYKRIDDMPFTEIKLDFVHNTQLYGVQLIDINTMFEKTFYHNGICVAHEAIRFLDKWLFIYLLGVKLPSKYHEIFQKICVNQQSYLYIILKPIFGSARAKNILSYIIKHGFDKMPPIGVKKRLFLLIRAIMYNPASHFISISCFIFFSVYNKLKSTGVFISLSGPDGSGKTTIIKHLETDLQKLYGENCYNQKHFRPKLLPRLAKLAKKIKVIDSIDVDYTKPHRAKPSAQIMSLFRYTYYVADYILGYYLRIKSKLSRSEVVLFDRYIYDLVSDPARSRISLPKCLLKTSFHIIPLPRHAFFIQTTPVKIRSRKDELTIVQATNLNRNYYELCQMGLLTPIQNDETSEKAAATIIDKIISNENSMINMR